MILIPSQAQGSLRQTPVRDNFLSPQSPCSLPEGFREREKVLDNNGETRAMTLPWPSGHRGAASLPRALGPGACCVTELSSFKPCAVWQGEYNLVPIWASGTPLLGSSCAADTCPIGIGSTCCLPCGPPDLAVGTEARTAGGRRGVCREGHESWKWLRNRLCGHEQGTIAHPERERWTPRSPPGNYWEKGLLLSWPPRGCSEE